MTDYGSIVSHDRRWRDLERALRAASAEAVIIVAACRAVLHRMDSETRRIAEVRRAPE
jgi:hypothetical protein